MNPHAGILNVMKLSSISTTTNMFSLIALDQVVSIADHLGLNLSNSQEIVALSEMMELLAKTYDPASTGMVVAPEFGFEIVSRLKDTNGVIFPLERRLFDADPLTIPILVAQWGVEAVRNNYGVAKLELFYHPDEKEASTKRQMVAELYDYCQHEKIDLMVELLIYIEGNDSEYAKLFPEVQLAAIQELRASCDLLALEYPLSALGAVTVTAELDIPWILTARDSAYEVFKEQLRTSLESGARGFVAMEQFLPPLPKSGKAQFNEAIMQQFITTTGRDRALELSRIVAESGKGLL